MTDVNIINKNKFIKDVIQKGKRKVDLKCFTNNKDIICNINSSNLELNKLNIRELSKLSDRPILQKKEPHNKEKNNIFSTEKDKQHSNYNINIKNIKTENMDIELKEKEEEKRKEEERRANIARKNCMSNKNLIIYLLFFYRRQRNRRSQKKSLYFIWSINFSR